MSGQHPRRAHRTALGLGVAVPVVAYLALAWRTRVDAPVLDDFDAILGFLNRFREAHGAGARLAQLFEVHVDHRLVVTRILALLQSHLQGGVDFVVLSAVGNLALLLLFCGIARQQLRKGAAGFLPLLPASLLFFQPQAFALVHFPTASIASYGVLLLSFLVFRLLERGTPSALAGAFACACIALLTQGNGVAVFPAALVALAIGGRWRLAMRWALLSVLPLVVQGATYEGRAAALGGEGWAGVPTALEYFLNLLGAAPAFGRAGASVAVALVLCGVGVWLVTARRPRLDGTLVGLALFVVFTAAGNAVMRSGFGAEYPLAQSRYRIYSVLALVLCHLLVSNTLRSPRARRLYQPAAALAALGFAVASFVAYAPRVERRATAVARSLVRWSLTGHGLLHPEPVRAGRILTRAERIGIFEPDATRLRRFLDRRSDVHFPEPTVGNVRAAVTKLSSDGKVLLIEGWAASPSISTERAEVFVVIGSAAERATFSSARLASRQGRIRFRSLILGSELLARGPIEVLLVDGERAGRVVVQ